MLQWSHWSYHTDTFYHKFLILKAFFYRMIDINEARVIIFFETKEVFPLDTSFSYYFEHKDAFPFPEFFEGMVHPWQPLEKVNAFLDALLVKPNVQEMHGIDKGGRISFYGNYYVGEGTVIYNDVTIMGPVYIGKNCEIMPGSIIRPNTIIGDNCVLGHCSEVKHSVVMNGAKIQSTSFCGDCVVGKSARIGSGVITANRKFDQSNATIKDNNGEKIDLGSSFFGCILGDNSRLGANSVTQPGTHIGAYTWVFPMTCVRGFIPREKRVYHERSLVFDENEVLELKP